METAPETLRFSAGLFRCKEYFRFEALTEVPLERRAGGVDKSIESQVIDGIKATHRIAETGKIRQLKLPPEDAYTKWRFKKRIIIPCGMLVAGLALSAFFLLMGHPGELRFEMVNSEGNMVETTIRPQLDGSIKIRSKEGSIDQRVAATEFFSRRDLRPKIRPERVSMYLDALMIAAYVLLPMGMLFMALRERRKWTRLRKQIGLHWDRSKKKSRRPHKLRR